MLFGGTGSLHNATAPSEVGQPPIPAVVKIAPITTTDLKPVAEAEPIPTVTYTPPAVSTPSVGCADPTATMQAAGIDPADYQYVDYIVSHEGSWCGTTRYNTGGSGAYGLCQALPGGKMASAGADWATNPVTQIIWCNSYAQEAKFGGWAGAYLYWVAHHYW